MILVRPLLSMLSPGGSCSHLSVFIFHRVLPQPDPIFPSEVDAVQFDKKIGWIKSWFNVLPLDDAVRRLKASTLPVRAAAITFDDGYADNFSVALPILTSHGLTATFFIATGFLDGGRMWNDTVIESIRACQLATLDLSALGLGCHPVSNFEKKRAAVSAVIGQIKYLPADQRGDITREISKMAQVIPPDDMMMTCRQVLALRRSGMQVGAHTVSHPILARLGLHEARQEIANSKAFLERLLEERISLFAYPNGRPGTDFLPEHPPMVRDLGFDAAVTTVWGTSNLRTDEFQIPRFTPWDQTKLRFGARMLANLRRT